MATAADKLRNLIRGRSSREIKKINEAVDTAVVSLRLNQSTGEDVKKVIQIIDDVNNTIKTIKDAVETIKFVKESLEAGKIAAQTTEKAATIGAALNPAAAAIQYAQKFVIERFNKEVEAIEEVSSEAEGIVEGLQNVTKEADEKIKEARKQGEKSKNAENDLKNEIN